MSGSDTQREAGWNQIMEKLSPECREWWDLVRAFPSCISFRHPCSHGALTAIPTQFLSQYDELVERSHGPGVKLGGYHLQVIGTVPEHQKKGVGKALIQYVENKVRNAYGTESCAKMTIGNE